MSKYCASHVANFFLDMAEEEKKTLTQLKLMKLVYIGFGWVSAVLDEEMFDEPILAWKHGPVVKSIYDEFKHFSYNPITSNAVEFDLENQKLSVPRIPSDDEDIRVVLGKVWDVYKNFTAGALRNKTHEPNTPWSESYGKSEAIDKTLIKTHFIKKISSYLDA